MLKEFPLVLWLESDGLIPSTGLGDIWNRTMRVNITTWALSNRCGTSSYTFPKMLQYFGFTADDLNYVPMIEVCYCTTSHM